MTIFEPGQKIYRKRGEGDSYCIPAEVMLTVSKSSGKGYLNIAEWKPGWYRGPYNPDCFDVWPPKLEWMTPQPDSPVRKRVTETTEIVSGNYHKVVVEYASNGSGLRVYTNLFHPVVADELRAAATVLNELAVALDAQAKERDK